MSKSRTRGRSHPTSPKGRFSYTYDYLPVTYIQPSRLFNNTYTPSSDYKPSRKPTGRYNTVPKRSRSTPYNQTGFTPTQLSSPIVNAPQNLVRLADYCSSSKERRRVIFANNQAGKGGQKPANWKPESFLRRKCR